MMAPLRGLPSKQLGQWLRSLQAVGEIESLARQVLRPLEQAIRETYRMLEGRKIALAGAYLDASVRRNSRLRLKTIRQQVANPLVRKALKAEGERRLARTVLRAIRTGTIRWGARLPRRTRYGAGLDERVIELPLAIEMARLRARGKVLDAGASLNRPFIRALIGRPRAELVHFTQSGDRESARFEGGQVSYAFGDLRATDFRDETFDRVLCISTLEHIGMDNTRYGGPAERSPSSSYDAFEELLRLLKQRGTLLATVPYGVPRSHGWFRIFGQKDVARLRALASGWQVDVRYYAYAGYWYGGTSFPLPVLRRSREAITGLAAVRIRKGTVEA